MEKPIGCVLILSDSRDRILLVLRDNKASIPFPNTWNLLGGFLEKEESADACIRREIREEIEIELPDIVLFREYDWDDCYEYIFWQRMDLNLARVVLNEGQALRYFSKPEIDRMVLAFQCHQVIDDFFGTVLNQRV